MPRFIAVLVLVISHSLLAGGEFRDPSGYSFTYPDGWFAVAKAGEAFAPEKLPLNTRDWLQRNNVQLDQIGMMLIRDTNEEFRENMNVVVRPGQTSLDTATARS